MAQEDFCLSTMLIALITACSLGAALALGGPHSQRCQAVTMSALTEEEPSVLSKRHLYQQEKSYLCFRKSSACSLGRNMGS